MSSSPQTAQHPVKPSPAPAKPEAEKAPLLPLDHFRMREKLEYMRLSDADKKLVVRYWNSFESGRDLVQRLRDFHAVFGTQGFGPMQMPGDFWPYVDKARGIEKPKPFRKPVQPPAPVDPLTHQVKPRAVKPVVLGMEFFQGAGRIEYERIADSEKAILGRWMKSCPEGLEIYDRISASVERQMELHGCVESIGYITVPFSFWQWLYEERNRMRDLERAAESAKVSG